MKILLATYWLLPHLGGVWPFMTQIKSRLEAMGHEVDLMGNSPDFQKYHIVNKGEELPKDTMMNLLRSKLTPFVPAELHTDPWVYNTELDRYCLELSAAYFGIDKYDLIHTQDVISTRAMSRVKSKRTALVANIHGSIAREVMLAVYQNNPSEAELRKNPIWNYYKMMEYFGATSADATLTSSYWLKNLLEKEYFVPPQCIANVIPYGLDTDQFWRSYAAGTSMAKPAYKKVIVCPARLAFIKGIEVLLQALGQLKWMRSDWVCWIAGDGELRAELEQQAASLGLQNDVQFLGYRDDIPALLGLADIFALPSLQDNQPFSVMEAQVVGKPAVVSDAGGLPEMVQHGKTGLVSPVGDAAAMAGHLNMLLENDQLRLQMGRNAKKWGQKHWSMDRMMDQLLNVYEQAFHRVNMFKH